MKKNVFLSILFVGVFISITSAQVKVNSAGNLGIGETVPDHAVHITKASPTLKLESSTSNYHTYLRLCEASNYAGGFLKYDGSANKFIIGTHNSWDSNTSNDKEILTITREHGRIDFWPTSTANYSTTLVTNAVNDLSKCYVVYRSGIDKFHVRGNGDIYIRESYHASDISLKEDITNLNSSVDLLTQLRPVKYKFKSDLGESTKDEKYSFGLIAQEVEEVIPEIVSMQDSVFKAINYTALIPLLIDAVKTQQEEIDELKAQLSKNTSDYKSSMVQASSDDLEGLSSAALFQNVPNPFNYNTIIKYFIPTIESYAMINVYDLSGSQVKSYNLTQTGNGEIMIPASELDPGLFIYNLIIDGIEIASQRMVLTE